MKHDTVKYIREKINGVNEKFIDDILIIIEKYQDKDFVTRAILEGLVSKIFISIQCADEK